MNILFDYDTVSRKPKIVSEYLSQIREHFSVEDKALMFLRKRTGRNLPVRKYAITNKGSFDLPFAGTIYQELKSKFPSSKIQFTEEFTKRVSSKAINEQLVSLNISPRDYQKASAEMALQKGRGVIVLPTSAGKTLVIALIASTILKHENDNILVLVPDIQLVQQTYQDFLDYGVDEQLISRWTGSHEYAGTKIVIANNQILLSEKQDQNILSSFSTIIVDECHKFATAEKISKLIKTLKCERIFGFTGSLPESKFDVWAINRIFWSIIFHKKSIDLRQDKYISKVRVVALEIDYNNIPEFSKPSVNDPTAGYEEEITWLHTNNYRNDIISKLITKLDTNTLILVDRIVHGEHLLAYLQSHTNKQIYFIQGSVELEERENMRKIMEENSGVVCIAISKIFSTGISIKNLHNIIFAAIGKARIKIIQSIGRSLRLHHTKQIATIFDIADTCLIYGKKHFDERMRLYEAENIPTISSKLYET